MSQIGSVRKSSVNLLKLIYEESKVFIKKYRNYIRNEFSDLLKKIFAFQK